MNKKKSTRVVVTDVENGYVISIRTKEYKEIAQKREILSDTQFYDDDDDFDGRISITKTFVATNFDEMIEIIKKNNF